MLRIGITVDVGSMRDDVCAIELLNIETSSVWRGSFAGISYARFCIVRHLVVTDANPQGSRHHKWLERHLLLTRLARAPDPSRRSHFFQ